MIKYQDLKKLAELRLNEAKVLEQNKMYDGAAYLCGYVVEIALKAKICKTLGITEYPDDGNYKSTFSSHDFDRLKLLAGLQEEITLKHKRLFTNWSLLTQWKPERRYDPVGTHSKQEVKQLFKALENPGWGFLGWIRKIW
jgi:HEPN domain-containing protein